MSSTLGHGTATTTSAPRKRRPTWQWCLSGVVVLLTLLLLAGVVLGRHLQGIVRSRLLQTFQERFHSPATIDDLQVHFAGQIQVDGRGLRVQSVLTGVPGDAAHPMLQVREFHFHLSVMAALSHSPRIHHVRIRGVQLELPDVAAGQSQSAEPDRAVHLEYAEVDDVHIHFAPGAADRSALQFDLPHIVFRGVTRSAPIRFHAVVDNGPPLGLSETDGTIGPWNFNDPRLTPLEGEFSFNDKDVSSVPGLRGRLTLHGKYRGTVASMHAEGTTDDPGFALDLSSHPVHLQTNFAMTLQPAESRVALERVEGFFGHSAFLCVGFAEKDRATDRFRLDLKLAAPRARVEDVLLLATRTAPPAMRGALSLTGRLQMRAGPQSVSKKLSLSGATFVVGDGSFGKPDVQQMFDELIERAQGNPERATMGRASHATAAMHGAVSLRNSVLQFQNVRVAAPGATATMHGTYSLSSAHFAFDGEVHTEARLSHMTRGVKSLLLRPFNRFFAHGKMDGASLPLHIKGTGSVPHLKTEVAGMHITPPGAE